MFCQGMLLEGNNSKSLRIKRKLERTHYKLQRLHKNTMHLVCCKLILPSLGTQWNKCRGLEIADK